VDDFIESLVQIAERIARTYLHDNTGGGGDGPPGVGASGHREDILRHPETVRRASPLSSSPSPPPPPPHHHHHITTIDILASGQQTA
jgi:hypothetical protein